MEKSWYITFVLYYILIYYSLLCNMPEDQLMPLKFFFKFCFVQCMMMCSPVLVSLCRLTQTMSLVCAHTHTSLQCMRFILALMWRNSSCDIILKRVAEPQCLSIRERVRWEYTLDGIPVQCTMHTLIYTYKEIYIGQSTHLNFFLFLNGAQEWTWPCSCAASALPDAAQAPLYTLKIRQFNVINT